jgi:plasmid stabilization system protein ParE
METKFTLQIEPKAREQIEEIAKYIATNGYPEAADKFALQLFEFAESLTQMPNKYAIYRKPAFKRWNYRCVTFHRNYVFIYKIMPQAVVLKQVLHGKQIK